MTVRGRPWGEFGSSMIPQGSCVPLQGVSPLTGRSSRYVIGCPDVYAFAEAYPQYIETVLSRGAGEKDVPVPKQLTTPEPWFVPGSEVTDPKPGQPLGVVNEAALAQLAYSPRWLLLEGSEGRAELVRRYRATMHIDLLAPFQGQGWGRRLIEAFVQSVREAVAAGKGDAGEGIQIGVAGDNDKVVPFYEKVGFKIYGGQKEGSIWMVKDL